MEQERITVIILISTVVVVVFVIAMIVLFSVFQHIKNKLLLENKSLQELIEENLPSIGL